MSHFALTSLAMPSVIANAALCSSVLGPHFAKCPKNQTLHYSHPYSLLRFSFLGCWDAVACMCPRWHDIKFYTDTFEHVGFGMVWIDNT